MQKGLAWGLRTPEAPIGDIKKDSTKGEEEEEEEKEEFRREGRR